MAGLALALLALVFYRVPGGDGRLGLDVSVAVQGGGELEVTPPRLFAAHGLEPGVDTPGAQGTAAIRNQTGAQLAVRLRALPSTRALDKILWADVRVAGEPLFRGSVGELRDWTRRRFVLRPGERRELSVRTWLPDWARSGYEARVEDLGLELRSRTVGS